MPIFSARSNFFSSSPWAMRRSWQHHCHLRQKWPREPKDGIDIYSAGRSVHNQHVSSSNCTFAVEVFNRKQFFNCDALRFDSFESIDLYSFTFASRWLCLHTSFMPGLKCLPMDVMARANTWLVWGWLVWSCLNSSTSHWAISIFSIIWLFERQTWKNIILHVSLGGFWLHILDTATNHK